MESKMCTIILLMDDGQVVLNRSHQVFHGRLDLDKLKRLFPGDAEIYPTELDGKTVSYSVKSGDDVYLVVFGEF